MSAQQSLAFVRLAPPVTRRGLPQCGHKFSPRRFSLPWLAACVLLKEYVQQD